MNLALPRQNLRRSGKRKINSPTCLKIAGLGSLVINLGICLTLFQVHLHGRYSGQGQHSSRISALFEEKPFNPKLERVLDAGNFHISVETAPTLDRTTNHTASRSPECSQAQRQKIEPENIKDEYFEHLNFTHSETDFTHEMFTNDYFEYEQGQKDILVKGRLKQNIDFWKSIVADKNDFIIDIILNGYKIPFYSEPESCILANNKSAKLESEFVSEAICDLLKRGLIEKCIDIPYVVNPLTVSVQNNNKKRLILDLRNVNKHVWKQSIKYEDLRIALLYLENGYYMFKFDLKSAYHFVEIYPPHTKYLGFS